MNIASTIDHTLLKPTATDKEFLKLCYEAKEHQFCCVCIPPYKVKALKELNPDLNICSVVGFPLGYNTTETKIAETTMLLGNGASEIDMVININQFLAKDYAYVLNEISSLKKLCGNNILKVIIETAYLNLDQILKATELCIEAKADFVKTSTGFAATGAKLEHVKAISSRFKDEIKIKASGGIKTLDQAKTFIDAGVSRLGTSSGISIIG